MTRTLAIELGRFSVNVNCVAPGFVSSAMTKQTAERIGVDVRGLPEDGAESTALQRIGEPEDIAAVIAFLCSEDASYVTGQCVRRRRPPLARRRLRRRVASDHRCVRGELPRGG
jgi:3-oxoacyl-[acyl-carrier protein] reductase